MNNKNIDNITARLLLGENTCINDHNFNTVKIDGYIILEGDDNITGIDNTICPTFIGTTFTLNYLYENKNDKKIHLSTFAVGGPMNGVYRDFDKEVAKYNKHNRSRKIINYHIFNS